MSSGLMLVTRGWIGRLERPEIIPLISCDEPDVRQVLEVRPAVRTIVAPADPEIVPRIVAGGSQVPTVTGEVEDYIPDPEVED